MESEETTFVSYSKMLNLGNDNQVSNSSSIYDQDGCRSVAVEEENSPGDD